MTQSKRIKPRGLCICKRGIVIRKDGMLSQHFPTKLKYTNRHGMCQGSGTLPIKTLMGMPEVGITIKLIQLAEVSN
jgi:hypothetical protein